jgi:hypothetical protein
LVAALRALLAATSAALPSTAAYSRPKTLGAEARRRLWECRNGPSAASPHAQALDQSADSGIEILLDLAMGTQRNLADRKLARVVAAGAEQFDQGLGLRHFGLVERAGRLAAGA